MKMFMVGGAVRDEILGVQSKDIDFTVVLENGDLRRRRSAVFNPNFIPLDPFKIMSENLRLMGFKIFLESPEFLTVRAQFPKNMLYGEDMVSYHGMTADFVLARKESDYTDGRRPDKVEVGTLEDDLARRDFTMNAIAKDTDGSLIDPFNGQQDIADGIIRAVGDPFERLSEDALRAVRALRFFVTKGFDLDGNLANAMESPPVLADITARISDERIKDELSKMFRFDTLASVQALGEFPLLTIAMFSGTVSLDATMKQKGRGK